MLDSFFLRGDLGIAVVVAGDDFGLAGTTPWLLLHRRRPDDSVLTALPSFMGDRVAVDDFGLSTPTRTRTGSPF